MGTLEKRGVVGAARYNTRKADHGRSLALLGAQYAPDVAHPKGVYAD
jgi:hypothetical protein